MFNVKCHESDVGHLTCNVAVAPHLPTPGEWKVELASDLWTQPVDWTCTVCVVNTEHLP